MEGTTTKGVGVKPPAREDMISKLPDSLISQYLLSCLPTKEAVRTSVLSKRWKSVWLLIPGLDLDSTEFPNSNAFVGFMERFIDFSRQEKSCLNKLELSIHKDVVDGWTCFTRWIDFVATPKLEHLDVECLLMKRDRLKVVPLSLYICEKLFYLRLHGVILGSFECVSLPCVKTMCLEHNVYANEACLESFISSCSVLEDLSIVRRVDDNVKVLRVRSQTLSSLSIKLAWDNDQDDNGDYCNDIYNEKRGVLIDSPRLEYLNLEERLSPSKTLVNSSSLAKVSLLHNFDLFGRSNEKVRTFFINISGVTDMNISHMAFKLIIGIMPNSPRFCNLTCLKVQLHFLNLEKMLNFLESCPNLKSLILDLLFSTVREQPRFAFVPQCLLSSLEFVEIRREYLDPITLKLARYFAENSIILKELSLGYSMLKGNAVALRDLLALPTRSGTCQIAVVEY